MHKAHETKTVIQRLVAPVARPLAKMGVNVPMMLVVIACLSAVVGLTLVKKAGHPHWLLLLPAALLVRALLDAIVDVFPAEVSVGTAMDAVLKELTVVLSDTALYAPLALWYGFSPPLVIAIVVLAVVSELAGAVAVQIGVSRRFDGPMAENGRAGVIGILTALAAFDLVPILWIKAILGAVIVLLLQTIWNRARRALRETVA